MLFEVGQLLEGKVSGITNFGAFIQLPGGKTGLVHISEVAEEYVKDISEHLKTNQPVKVKVLAVEPNGKISLSIKKAFENASVKVKKPVEIDWSKEGSSQLSFEERLSKFMKDSDEKLLDLKRSFETKRGGGYRKSSQYF